METFITIYVIVAMAFFIGLMWGETFTLSRTLMSFVFGAFFPFALLWYLYETVVRKKQY